MGAAKANKDLVLRGGVAPRRAAARAREWTARMAERFAEALADTCNVRAAAKAIRRSVTNVYLHRARDATFRAQWDQALAIGYSRLEMMLLERALHGVEKTVVAKDGSTSVMTHYSDQTALALLRMHRDSVANSEQPIAEQEYAEARDRILARIERIRVKKGIRFETKGFRQLEALLTRGGRWSALREGTAREIAADAAPCRGPGADEPAAARAVAWRNGRADRCARAKS